MLTSGYVSDGQVVFFEGVDKIYQREYQHEKISSVTIPETVTAIQSEAFAHCTSLTSIVIPDSVKKISTRCFDGCTGLKKVVLPSGVKVIDEYVFYGCTGLEEIVIPDSVTKIARGAFSGCTSLSNVVLPGKLKTIGKNAFRGCKFESIAFPDSLETIEMDAFAECPLTRLHIPSHVKSLNGFRSTNLEEVIMDEGVETISESCFEGCASLVSLAIPESVRKIARSAFGDCTSLQRLKLPKNMDILENEAFRGCSKLDRIDVPEGVTKIPCALFAGCTSAHVHLSSTVKEFNTVNMNERGYYGRGHNDMASMSVSSANEVLAMESDCLIDKRKRELLHVLPHATAFPKNLKSINLPDDFFPPLLDREELVIPEGVTHISSLPFRRMRKLKKLVLPVTLQSLGYSFLREYPFSSISVPPELLLSEGLYSWPARVDLTGIESVSEELRLEIEKRFASGWSWGSNGTSVYFDGQLVFPAAEVLRAREEAREKARLEKMRREMTEKIEDMTIFSLCRTTFEPAGFEFNYLESENRLTVTVFDSLKIEHVLAMDTAQTDLTFLLEVAASYRNALNPYISASSDPHLVINPDWKKYDGTKYLSSRLFPDVIVRLSLEPRAVAAAFQALENLENAYTDMLCKYGDRAEKLVSQNKKF